MKNECDTNQGQRLRLAIASGGTTLVTSACATTGGGLGGPVQHGDKTEEEVSPGEDLMREHGVLERILLI